MASPREETRSARANEASTSTSIASAVLRIAVRRAVNGRIGTRVDDGEWVVGRTEPIDLASSSTQAGADLLHDYGGSLFEVLAENPEFRARYDTALSGDSSHTLRIELTIARDEGAAEVCPTYEAGRHLWETAYDARTGTYLALTNKLHFVRRHDGARAVATPGPKTSLILAAGFAAPFYDEHGRELAQPLNLLGELDAIKEIGDRYRDVMDVRDEPVLGLRNFETMISDADIFHFAGHGDHGALQLCGAESRREAMSATTIQQSIASAPRLVVLNCCRGSAAPAAAAESVALSFLRAGAPAVVAMQGDIEDAASAQLTRTLYGALLEKGDVADATQRTRRSLYAKWPDRNWFLPVVWIASDPPVSLRVGDSPTVALEVPVPSPTTPVPWKLVGVFAALALTMVVAIEAVRRLVQDDPTSCIEDVLERAEVASDRRNRLATLLADAGTDGPVLDPEGVDLDSFDRVNTNAVLDEIGACIDRDAPTLRLRVELEILEQTTGKPYVGAVVKSGDGSCRVDEDGRCDLVTSVRAGLREADLRVFAPGVDVAKADPIAMWSTPLSAVFEGGPPFLVKKDEDETTSSDDTERDPTITATTGGDTGTGGTDTGGCENPCPAVRRTIKAALSGKTHPSGTVTVKSSGAVTATPAALQRLVAAVKVTRDMCRQTCTVPVAGTLPPKAEVCKEVEKWARRLAQQSTDPLVEHVKVGANGAIVSSRANITGKVVGVEMHGYTCDFDL